MLYYVSDIHVEHKIDFDALPEEMPEEEFGEVVADIADKVFVSTMAHTDNDYLLVAGDTCENTHIGHYFFGQLTKMWKPDHIIVVLGNHEMWIPGQAWTDDNESIKPNTISVISAWRKVFRKLGVTMLQNETVELPDLNAVVLGGIGFSGQNDDFNAARGLYQKTLTARNQDRYQSRNFDGLYKRTVQRCEAENKKLIVLTHNPWRDWHNGNIENENASIPIVYISGHTHRNKKIEIDTGTVKKKILEDSQIGYPIRRHYSVKSFSI